MNKMFLCSTRIIGFPFLVETIDEAEAWVEQSPKWNYYEELEIRKIERV